MSQPIPVCAADGRVMFRIQPSGLATRHGGQFDPAASLSGRTPFGFWKFDSCRGLFGEAIDYFRVYEGDVVRRVRPPETAPTRALGEEWWELIECNHAEGGCK